MRLVPAEEHGRPFALPAKYRVSARLPGIGTLIRPVVTNICFHNAGLYRILFDRSPARSVSR
jgi:hypothetical protein